MIYLEIKFQPAISQAYNKLKAGYAPEKQP